MKKILVLALGLGIALGTVSFAQDKMDDKKMDNSTSKTKTKKAKKSKKGDKMDTTTPADKKM